MKIIPHEDLSSTDLTIDAVYEGAATGNLSGEVLSKLLPGIGNQGGFRAAGLGKDKKFVVLYTSGEDNDWPDHLALNTGRFEYYGDNRTPGQELHDSTRGGNQILRQAYGLLHATPPDRTKVPPFFIFKKFPSHNNTRKVQFKGLAAPGYKGLSQTDDLVAIWKTSNEQRFQNYRATFTVLDAPVINRTWLNDLADGRSLTVNAPASWTGWVSTGRYTALAAESTTVIRYEVNQVPDTPDKMDILEIVWEHFKGAPHAFEKFAAHLFNMHDERNIIDEITRSSVDGGRDAIGRSLLGLSDDPIYAEFSLEAKCYRPPLKGKKAHAVGVKEVARLISRIRHRQFGVMVTTSVIGRQAYKEVRDDRHPIIFISGKDITDILTKKGFSTSDIVKQKLESEFSLDDIKP